MGRGEGPVTIPRILHRIYLDEPIESRFEEFWDRFAALHPGWDLATWSRSADLGWMANLDAFTAAKTWAGKSDIARYEIVHRYGGVYVDCDVEPLRAFDELLEGAPFAGWENDRLICPTVIGAPAGHPAMAALVDGLPAWIKRHRGRPPNIQTGPHYLTRMWRDRTDVRLLDREAFYPVGWWERAKLGGPYPPESFSVHHWNQGWDPEAKARIDARQ